MFARFHLTLASPPEVSANPDVAKVFALLSAFL